ncbi:hypothetical protein D9M71_348870 [compost metagenome]
MLQANGAGGIAGVGVEHRLPVDGFILVQHPLGALAADGLGDGLPGVRGRHRPIAGTGNGRTVFQQRARRVHVLEFHGADIGLEQVDAHFIGRSPIQLHGGDDIQWFEAGELLGVDHLQVGDRMSHVTVPLVTGLLDAVERLAHRAVADGVHMHQPATGIGGADQLAKMRRVDQQFTGLVGVLVGLKQGSRLRGNFSHAVGENLDAGQAEVVGASELLSDLVQNVQVGWRALGVGDH